MICSRMNCLAFEENDTVFEGAARDEILFGPFFMPY